MLEVFERLASGNAKGGFLQQVQAEFAHAARVSMLGELTASIARSRSQPAACCDADQWRNRASNIVARIRAMAAARAPQQTVLALRDVIMESMLFLRRELQLKEVSASLDLAPALPQVVGDRTQLQ